MDTTLRGRLLRDDEGATAVEYAVMLGLIIAVAMAAIGLFGGGVEARWEDNAGKIIGAMRQAGT